MSMAPFPQTERDPVKLIEALAEVLGHLPKEVSREMHKYPEYALLLCRLALNPQDTSLVQLHDWDLFYRDHFNLDVNVRTLRVPEPVEGFDRLVVVPRKLSLSRVIAECQKHFRVLWKYQRETISAKRLALFFGSHDRDQRQGTYVVRVRDTQEADSECPLDQVVVDRYHDRGMYGVTLMERLLLELKFLEEEKSSSPMDLSTTTICSGTARQAEHSLAWVFPGVSRTTNEMLIVPYSAKVSQKIEIDIGHEHYVLGMRPHGVGIISCDKPRLRQVISYF